LGINAHSMFKFFSRALSNNELQNWQTETTLTIMIRETLSEYEISLSQVYYYDGKLCQFVIGNQIVIWRLYY
jgi:hypothetical protein